MPDPVGIEPFEQFLESLHAARPEHFLATPDTRVTHEDAFGEMRQHLLAHYDGVTSECSFVDANGSVFDCVPVEKQPALRESREAPSKPPDLPRPASSDMPTAPRGARAQPLSPERLDRHGNRMYAPEGTIPLRRLTMENLARFETLQHFFQKSPMGGVRPPLASGNQQSASNGVARGGIDLRGASLRGADLRGADLRGADLRGASLCGADLRGADLRGADLRGVNLAGADLRGADLRRAIFGTAGLGGPLLPPPSVNVSEHHWAHAAQGIANIGGHSFLNIWDPPIDSGQVFSLSQHWYVGGSGAGLQTAEVGWQVYPQMYGDRKPVLFVYWTADDYNTTGSYNLTRSDFVQISNAWLVGGALSFWSTLGGEQQEIELAYHLSAGRWWLYVGGEGSTHAIGYYPVGLYRGGAMSSGAAEIDYGGEVVGAGRWPAMGSGGFAAGGWRQAAYQRDIRYFESGRSVSPDLTASMTAPQWYTATVQRYGAPWNETIFFGGPGSG